MFHKWRHSKAGVSNTHTRPANSICVAYHQHSHLFHIFLNISGGLHKKLQVKTNLKWNNDLCQPTGIFLVFLSILIVAEQFFLSYSAREGFFPSNASPHSHEFDLKGHGEGYYGTTGSIKKGRKCVTSFLITDEIISFFWNNHCKSIKPNRTYCFAVWYRKTTVTYNMCTDNWIVTYNNNKNLNWKTCFILPPTQIPQKNTFFKITFLCVREIVVSSSWPLNCTLKIYGNNSNSNNSNSNNSNSNNSNS